MNKIIRHTEYLISRYDCVIIPGLGAILAQYVPAEFDAETGNMLPPKRVFTFNSAITDNDGLLAASIARASNIPVQRALQAVRLEVENIKHELRERRFFTIGRVGTLFCNQAGTSITFKPSDQLISVSTLWLDDVKVVEIEDKEQTNIVEAPIRKRSSHAFFEIGRVAAIAALIVGAWFLISSPFTFDDAMKASLIPEWLFNIDVSQVQNDDTELIADNNAEAETPIDVNEAAPVEEAVEHAVEEAAPVETVVEQPAVEDETDYEYYVIVGVTASADEACKFIEMNPTYQLRVMKYGKQHRVYISAHHTADEAAMGCINARNFFPDAWIANK